MKNSKFAALVILCLSVSGLFFTSCKQDDLPKDPGGDKGPLMLIGEWERWNPIDGNCRWGGVLCPNQMDDSDVLDALHTATVFDNEVAGTGRLKFNGGSHVLSFDFTKHQLGNEATNRLLEERVITLEDSELSPELVEKMYKQAGKKYPNRPVNIKEGAYEVRVISDETGAIPTAQNMKIKVDITLLGDATFVEYSVYK